MSYPPVPDVPPTVPYDPNQEGYGQVYFSNFVTDTATFVDPSSYTPAPFTAPPVALESLQSSSGLAPLNGVMLMNEMSHPIHKYERDDDNCWEPRQPVKRQKG